MGARSGHIVEEDTPVARIAAHIRRFRLSNGDHVYLPRAVAAVAMEHSPAEEFVFVEKGLFGRIGWAGTMQEARAALVSGEISARDLKGITRRHLEAPQGWFPTFYDDDHAKVGGKLGALTLTMRDNGHIEVADAMTLGGWLESMRRDGACLQMRVDSTHGTVWCWRSLGHEDGHGPACPACEIVKDVMNGRRGGRCLGRLVAERRSRGRQLIRSPLS